ncbi:gluconate kinase [Nostoc sp. CENA543]|uniref:gluconokinase n=1 Tax=Nostoc sp. CENA543 TaxID=1869241 RepID=UPI000CA154CF|nr:gluconokinase [Nostoc sp. CENA543]AUT03809.1 gluconate kinase [Nostoc sp. CENA543]
MIILLMGVSGSGKTTIGQMLATSLNWEFIDADDFHSPENVEKMRRGIPLSEADRIPWLQDLQTAIKQWLQENRNVVLACSALKASYRQFLVIDRDDALPTVGDDAPPTVGDRIKIVYLKGSYDVIQQRLQARQNHYMNPTLLKSQFTTLEEPLDAVCIDVTAPPQVIVRDIRTALQI